VVFAPFLSGKLRLQARSSILRLIAKATRQEIASETGWISRKSSVFPGISAAIVSADADLKWSNVGADPKRNTATNAGKAQ
jgi:hypothetical protein